MKLGETQDHKLDRFLLRYVFNMLNLWACCIVSEHSSNDGKGKVQYCIQAVGKSIWIYHMGLG